MANITLNSLSSTLAKTILSHYRINISKRNSKDYVMSNQPEDLKRFPAAFSSVRNKKTKKKIKLRETVRSL